MIWARTIALILMAAQLVLLAVHVRPGVSPWLHLLAGSVALFIVLLLRRKE